LDHIHYTILGLGDSNYSKYQAVPRRLDDKLKSLGGKKFYTRGEADEATSLEDTVEPWIENLWKELDQEIVGVKKTLNDVASLSTNVSEIKQEDLKCENDQECLEMKADIIES
jgi:methionine synthase reductase